MTIEQLVSLQIPTLLPTDTGNQALHLMDENNLAQLPVVVENKYLALVKENDMLEWESPGRPLNAGHFFNFRPAISHQSHPLEAWRIAQQEHLNILPVIGNAEQYLGAVTRDALMNYVSENTGLQTPGGIIVLSMKRSQYSLSEIAQISENEDVTITSVSTANTGDSELIEVTIKTNRTDLSALIASLERHDYEVLHVFGAESGQDDVLNRYQLLMNYINM